MPKPLAAVTIGALLVVGLVVGLLLARSDLGRDAVEALIGDEPAPAPTPTASPPGPTPGPTPVRTPVGGPLAAPPASEVYWGAHTDDAPGTEALERLEDVTGERPAILMWYLDWEAEAPFPVERATALAEDGVVPFVTWEPWDPAPDDPTHSPAEAREVAEQPDYRLARIADGAFDEYVTSFAEQVVEYGGPLLLRFAHEMDGFWYPWGGTVNDNTPTDYVHAWRHVHDVFSEAGATNVTWVWGPNHLSVPDEPGNAIDEYWPGGAYVDWVGVSGFNFGAASDETPDWSTFDEIYADRLDELAAYDKPIVLAEIGSVDQGGDKADWIDDALERILATDAVAAFVWFDIEVPGVKDWRIASSEEAREAFRSWLRDDRVLSAPAGVEQDGRTS